jgi:predicted ester cyclase
MLCSTSCASPTSLCTGEGDFVAMLHIHHAVNDGPFNGMPATGRTVHVPGIELFRFRDGKIAEFWRFDADLSLMMQLGAIPAPALA